MDRIHFIEHAVERLDDEAFAAFLMWFDHYADMRWAGRWPDVDTSAASHVGTHAPLRMDPHAGSHVSLRVMSHTIAHAVAHSVASTPARVCEPQLAAWSAQAAHKE